MNLGTEKVHNEQTSFEEKRMQLRSYIIKSVFIKLAPSKVIPIILLFPPHRSFLLIAPSSSSLLSPHRSFLLIAPSSSSLLPTRCSFHLVAPSSSSLLPPRRSFLHVAPCFHLAPSSSLLLHSETTNSFRSAILTKASPTD